MSKVAIITGGSRGIGAATAVAFARRGWEVCVASKDALDTMTLGLTKEVANEGIRVNAVRPGLIRTEIHAREGQPDRVEDLRSLLPMQRGGEPEEVAEAIHWLCSTEASYVTGALLDVAGGR